MQKNLVVTLIGQDNVGMVENITDIILKYNGNVLESKMARLGGEFTMLLQINIENDNLPSLELAFTKLKNNGYQIFYQETSGGISEKFLGWIPYEIIVTGADHEGIINHITHQIAKNGMNIESIDTKTTSAAMSGTMLFTMNAIVLAPPKKTIHNWAEQLDDVAEEMNVDIEIYNYKG